MKKGMLFEAVTVTLLILLSFTMYVMVTTAPASKDSWTVTGLVTTSNMSLNNFNSLIGNNMFTGENGVLYTIDGRNIHAVGQNGSVLWSVAIPDSYNMTVYGRTYNLSAVGDIDTWVGLDAKVSNDTLYIIVLPRSPLQIPGVLLAISSNGTLEWKLPFSSSSYGSNDGAYIYDSPRYLSVINDTIYIGTYSGRDVISMNGTFLWKIDDYLYMNSSVDEEGNIYAITADLKPIGRRDDKTGINIYFDNSTDYPIHEGLANGTVMGGSYNAVTAYYSNGTVKWHAGMRELGINDSLISPYYDENDPTYRNGTIYVWMSHSVLALDKSGNLKWSRTFDNDSIVKTWFGPNDTLYVRYGRGGNDSLVAALYGSSLYNPLGRGDVHIVSISPDGNMKSIPDSVASAYIPDFLGSQQFSGDTVYKIDYVSPFASDENVTRILSLYFDLHGYIEDYLKANGGNWDLPRGLYDLDTVRVTAYKIGSSVPMWSYTIPLNKHLVRLDKDNVQSILMYPGIVDNDNNATPAEWYRSHSIPEGSEGIGSACSIGIVEVNGVQYLSFWSYNYEVPTFYGDSRCVYSGGLYALDDNGTLLWSKDMDSRIVSLKSSNGTVYYSTSNGKLSSIGTGAIAGLFTVALYLFLRFFLAGAVTRVRGRVNKNENRNRILQFIIDRPGCGLYDISQKLGINMGTARYHLLILGLNHKIVQYRSDGKYIRYFTNSLSYSPEEQLIISLMRRDGIGKVLRLLLLDPGMSNVDLSKALDVQESVTSRYMKELLERGVVAKAQASDGRLSYSVKAEYNDTVGSVAKRLNGS